MTAAPASADNITPICHATGSDTNPYLYKEIDQSSTDPDGQGHGSHFSDPQMSWGNQGVWWNGTWYAPDTKKPDILGPQVTQAYCEAEGTKGPLEVTPRVTFVNPTCDVALGINFENDDKVIYTVSGLQQPGGSVTVTATPEPGYEFPRNADSTWTHTFGAAGDCRGTLVPQVPSAVPPACTGPGTSSPLVVTGASGPTGISYGVETGASTYTVTATITDVTKKFPAQADMPEGWDRVDDDTATYTKTFAPAGPCLVSVSVTTEPSATVNTCTLDGQLVLPAGTGYTWTGQTANTPGSHTVTAVAATGYQLTGQATWTIPVKAAGEGLTCPGTGTDATEVTPLAPAFIEAGCTTDPRIDYRPVTGVSYGYTGDLAPGGTVTVSAVALKDYVLKAGETATWSHTFLAKPTGAACGQGGGPVVVPTPDLDELVSPRYPSATGATCSRDGGLVVPAQPSGVLVEQTGTAPGDVTFTYTPASGFAFPAGTDTEVTVTVPAQLTGGDCIKGVETSRPEPKPGTNQPGSDGPAAGPVNAGTDAEVLGEQAVAVPTAVAAGLGDTMTDATSTASPQLAQALVAAGLLMLVMGGATGLGRRTRGAHES